MLTRITWELHHAKIWTNQEPWNDVLPRPMFSQALASLSAGAAPGVVQLPGNTSMPVRASRKLLVFTLQ